MADTKVDNTILLAQYASETRTSQVQPPRELFWNRLAISFKREVEISFKRGGPVGKSLLKNKQFIIDSMEELMSTSAAHLYNQYGLNAMLNSLNILSPESL